MTTCAECRYHHDRGCYIAPMSAFRLADVPACAQIATVVAQDAPGAPQQPAEVAYGYETVGDVGCRVKRYIRPTTTEEA